MTISLGADPELFLVDRQQQPVPVCGHIGGTKNRPLSLGKDGYAIQEDNVMVEYNVPPTRNAEEFANSLETAATLVSEFVAEKLPNVHFSDKSSILFPNSSLVHEGAKTFGCSADYDAYDRGARLPTVVQEDLREDGGEWRFAGGHVHIGYDNRTSVPDFVVAAFADVFLGLPSVRLDKQGTRRTLYGQPGRYRPTKYGIEYRTLSNYWVSDYETAYAVGRGAMALGYLIENADESRLQGLFRSLPWVDIRAAIAGENVSAANDLSAFLREESNLPELAQ